MEKRAIFQNPQACPGSDLGGPEVKILAAGAASIRETGRIWNLKWQHRRMVVDQTEI